MTKVQRKTKSKKSDEIDKLKEMVRKYRSVYLFAYKNLKAKQIHEWRDDVRGRGYLYFGKKSLVRQVIENKEFCGLMKGHTFLLFMDERVDFPGAELLCEVNFKDGKETLNLVNEKLESEQIENKNAEE